MKSTISGEKSFFVDDVDGVTVVRFPGTLVLDEEHVRDTAQKLYHLATDSAGKAIVLNFSNVKFISSQALGVVFALYKKVTNNQGNLTVCAMSPMLRELFEIVHLGQLFPFYQTQAEAVRALRQRSEGRT